jgi:hypothetical protein
MQKAVACASPPILANDPPDALRIAGSQDVVNRDLFGTPEVLVLSGGTDHDVRVNNLYYVRRVLRPAETINDRKQPHTVQTTGWVRVVSVNERMALVSTEHTCTEMRVGDYLEPFVPPTLPEGDTSPLTRGEQDFEAIRGSCHGRMTGWPLARRVHRHRPRIDPTSRWLAFAIWRDLQATGMPLTAIGERRPSRWVRRVRCCW